MPISDWFLPYDPPVRSNIRERLLRQQTRRVGELEKQARLLEVQALNPRLSLYESTSLKDEAMLRRTFIARSNELIEAVRKQDTASAAAERALKLRPSSVRLGREEHRSTRDRNLAILGILDRERRRNAALSRAALGRAQAIAASRQQFDPSSSQLRGTRGYEYAVGPGELASPLADTVDPCVELRARQQRRREVIFATGYAMRGYRGRHIKRVC